MLISRTLKNAIVIPQRATFENLAKRYVYVVGKDDVVHQREIVVQNEMDDIFVIKKGLDVNDRIVLEGVRQVRDGEKVEYEFRTPEDGDGKPKKPRRIATASRYGTRRDYLRTMFANILHRPALAIVISVLIVFLGALAINTLPISQFPSVAPPSVIVAVSYPGASAEVLVDSVLIILEQAINGVQDMRYMASAATSAGEGAIQIIFEPGTDPNVAVLNVNNRIAIVKNRLPPIVEREGIIVMQAMTSMLMYVNVYSTDKSVDQNFLYNYVTVNLLPEIRRTRGIGSAKILGNRAYAMRIMLNIDRMRAYKVSADDVMKAVAEQSMIGSPGRLGQATGKTSQTFEYVLTWVGRYNKPEQYENIILKANPDGEILRIKDVAKVELGSSFYDLYSDIDGNPSAAIVLKQLPGTNAATIIEEVKEKLKEFKAEIVPSRHGL